MVAILLKYTQEELKSKSQKFYCGSGLVRCKVTFTEKGESRYSTADKPKAEVLKVHYSVAEGEYLGAENNIEFDLWTDEVFEGGEPKMKAAAKSYVAFSIAAGFESYPKESDLLVDKLLLINHHIKKGEVITKVDEYGNKVPELDDNGKEQFYPDESEIAKGRGKKFARVDSKLAAHIAQTADSSAIVAPVASAVVAPQAPAPVTYTPPPAEPAVDDDIPW